MEPAQEPVQREAEEPVQHEEQKPAQDEIHEGLAASENAPADQASGKSSSQGDAFNIRSAYLALPLSTVGSVCASACSLCTLTMNYLQL